MAAPPQLTASFATAMPGHPTRAVTAAILIQFIVDILAGKFAPPGRLLRVVAHAIFGQRGLVRLARAVQRDYVHDDNKHAHEKLSVDPDLLPMSSLLPISFVLHDVARLLRKRFEKRSRASGLSRAQSGVLAWLPYLTPQARARLESMAGNGQRTRGEAFAGPSPETRQHLLQTLIKSNLLAACTQPAVDREKVHG